jgi:hypothetical protein
VLGGASLVRREGFSNSGTKITPHEAISVLMELFLLCKYSVSYRRAKVAFVKVGTFPSGCGFLGFNAKEIMKPRES